MRIFTTSMGFVNAVAVHTAMPEVESSRPIFVVAGDKDSADAPEACDIPLKQLTTENSSPFGASCGPAPTRSTTVQTCSPALCKRARACTTLPREVDMHSDQPECFGLCSAVQGCTEIVRARPHAFQRSPGS